MFRSTFKPRNASSPFAELVPEHGGIPRILGGGSDGLCTASLLPGGLCDRTGARSWREAAATGRERGACLRKSSINLDFCIIGIIFAPARNNRTHSLMDRIKDSGSFDYGSTPYGFTKYLLYRRNWLGKAKTLESRTILSLLLSFYFIKNSLELLADAK